MGLAVVSVEIARVDLATRASGATHDYRLVSPVHVVVPFLVAELRRWKNGGDCSSYDMDLPATEVTASAHAHGTKIHHPKHVWLLQSLRAE